MHYPQLIVYESERRLATWLREAIDIAEMLRYDEAGQPASRLGKRIHPGSREEIASGWLFREPRQPAACLRLLRRSAPAVVVIQLTKEADAELTLLDKVTWTYPDALTVVVGGEEHRALSSLAWDFGATAVLLPPRVGERLQETVVGLMRSVMALAAPNISPGLIDES